MTRRTTLAASLVAALLLLPVAAAEGEDGKCLHVDPRTTPPRIHVALGCLNDVLVVEPTSAGNDVIGILLP